jgi:hypothetical protein
MEFHIMPGNTDLRRDASQPGLWVNANWSPGAAGLFGVVIGVSRYSHLSGGEDEAPDTYGLGQLAVSALTAFRVLEWLRDDFYVPDCPLAKCWVLLSPTDAELQHEPGFRHHTTQATFEQCRLALGYWRQELMGVPSASAENSRSLFFFSGHGLESHQEKQLLLASDYLRPPNRNENEAVSTQNLRFGLASSRVSRQFFFLDACRNDHSRLRQKVLDGTKVLSEAPASEWNPNIVNPVLFATSSGQQAWQQPTPAKGISLFGTALCEGLRGKSTIQLDRRGSWCAIKVFALQMFVEAEVVRQLARANARQVQPVRLGGSVRNEDVTHVYNPGPAGQPADGIRGGIGMPVTRLTGDDALRNIETVEALAMGTRQDATKMPPSGAWAAETWGIRHELFGHESLADIWSDPIRLYAIHGRRELSVDNLALESVTMARDGTGGRVELSIKAEDPTGFWLQVRDGTDCPYAAVLPSDRCQSARYLIEFGVRDAPDGRTEIEHFRASLASTNSELLAKAVDIWRRYQAADLAGAVDEFEASELQHIVREKIESPLAATVAALVLLRADRTDLLRDWLDNLANGFPEMTDPPVLRAWQLARTESQSLMTLQDAADRLAQLEPRGLCCTTEGIAYAASLADRMLTLDKQIDVRVVQRVKERLDIALAHFRPGGLFVALSGFPPTTVPWELIGGCGFCPRKPGESQR